MPRLQITKGAALLLRAMIVSCGNINCFDAMKILEGVSGNVEYDLVAKIPGYSYRFKAFERLEKYAEMNKLSTIDVYDVAMYFGGDYHVSVFEDFAHEGVLARYLGEVGDDFGLVGHVLLPLEEDTYANGSYKVQIKGVFHIDPKAPGTPCFHLGLIVNVPLTKAQIAKILKTQLENEVFVEHLKKLPKVIEIPKEYFLALNCVANKQSF